MDAWDRCAALDPAEPWQTSLTCLPRRSALENREPLTLQFRWKTGRVSLVQVVLNHREKEKATGWIGSVIECVAPFPSLTTFLTSP